jgi:hypothetical protein
VALFADRARRADAQFRLDEQTSPTAARLVRRLDGMPLAIELAAARVEAPGCRRRADLTRLALAVLAPGEAVTARMPGRQLRCSPRFRSTRPGRLHDSFRAHPPCRFGVRSGIAGRECRCIQVTRFGVRCQTDLAALFWPGITAVTEPALRELPGSRKPQPRETSASGPFRLSLLGSGPQGGVVRMRGGFGDVEVGVDVQGVLPVLACPAGLARWRGRTRPGHDGRGPAGSGPRSGGSGSARCLRPEHLSLSPVHAAAGTGLGQVSPRLPGQPG